MVFSALRFSALVVAALPLVSASIEHRAMRRGHHPHFEARGSAGKCIASSWEQVGERVFDYVIAGGGTAGLALAGRLSEDEDVTVAVIEAGNAAYGAQEARITTPNAAYYESSVGTDLDWQYKTTKQAGTGREMSWPRGKALGGSSAINGLYYTQASVREHQAWSRLATGSADDTERWGWHAMRDAHQKATEYMGNSVRELDSSVAARANETLGHHGPLAVAYPARSYSSVAAWEPAFASMGINAAAAPYDGETHGAFVAASTLDTAQWTRSFSRSAYVDPICDKRANLVVLPDQHVTKVIFDDDDTTEGSRRALGLEFAASKDAPRVRVTARREVILSAGAIGSAQLLQLSGVGRKELLEKHGIDVVYDLPGVGRNLQDHLAVSTSSKAKEGVPLPSNASPSDRQLNSYVDGAVAYLTVRDIFGDDTEAFLKRAEAASDKYAEASDMPAAVKRGYRRQVRLLLRDLLSDKSALGFEGHAKPVLEMLLGTMGGSINFEAAGQAPFSRGYVSISSSDAFDAPSIDAGYLGHDTDLELLVAGIKIARRAASTPSYAALIESETTPGTNVSSDSYEQLIAYVRDSAQTNYHPTSTCSMLPEHLGGVVDQYMRVYGTNNLRVVDASVIPVSLSTHTQSTTYAIAERAADILKQARREGHSEPVEECEEEEEEDDDEEEECEA